jgi:Ulp1 family protease
LNKITNLDAADLSLSLSHVRSNIHETEMQANEFRRLLPKYWLSTDTVGWPRFYMKNNSSYNGSSLVMEPGFYTGFMSHSEAEKFVRGYYPDFTHGLGNHKLVIFPINVDDNHWVVGALNYDDKEILYWDSIYRVQPASGFEERMRNILKYQFNTSRPADMSSVTVEDWVGSWKLQVQVFVPLIWFWRNREVPLGLRKLPKI